MVMLMTVYTQSEIYINDMATKYAAMAASEAAAAAAAVGRFPIQTSVHLKSLASHYCAFVEFQCGFTMEAP